MTLKHALDLLIFSRLLPYGAVVFNYPEDKTLASICGDGRSFVVYVCDSGYKSKFCSEFGIDSNQDYEHVDHTISVTFIHPTDDKSVEVEIDPNLMAFMAINELIAAQFIPCSYDCYYLRVKNDVRNTGILISGNQTFASVGVTDGSVINIGTCCGGAPGHVDYEAVFCKIEKGESFNEFIRAEPITITCGLGSYDGEWSEKRFEIELDPTLTLSAFIKNLIECGLIKQSFYLSAHITYGKYYFKEYGASLINLGLYIMDHILIFLKESLMVMIIGIFL